MLSTLHVTRSTPRSSVNPDARAHARSRGRARTLGCILSIALSFAWPMRPGSAQATDAAAAARRDDAPVAPSTVPASSPVVPPSASPPPAFEPDRIEPEAAVPTARDRPSRVVPAGSLDLSPRVFKSAVTAADADWAPSASQGTFGTERTSSRTRTDRSFTALQLGTCGGPDASSVDPLPVWSDFVTGVPALPYGIGALPVGHCRF